MNLYGILSHLHSINRWLVLLFLVWALISAISARGTMNVADSAGASVLPKGALPAFITTHIQLLLGLLLWGGALAGWSGVGSPYVKMDKAAWEGAGGEIMRFYSVDHFTYMLPAIILITIGYSVAKRSGKMATGAFWIMATYGHALALNLYAIPWPWGHLDAVWG